MNAARKINISVQTVALITAGILLVPFLIMQFTNEVNWSLFDFLIMGGIIFGSGLALRYFVNQSDQLAYRIGIALAIGTTFLLIWANLAVGLIASGANTANLMYIGVIGIGITGAFMTRLAAKGAERTMYAIVLGLVLHTIIALGIGAHKLPGSSPMEIFMVNGFFIFLYLCAALAFRVRKND